MSSEELSGDNESEEGMACLSGCNACDLNTYALGLEKPDGETTRMELLLQYGEIRSLEPLKTDNRSSLLHSKRVHIDT